MPTNQSEIHRMYGHVWPMASFGLGYEDLQPLCFHPGSSRELSLQQQLPRSHTWARLLSARAGGRGNGGGAEDGHFPETIGAMEFHNHIIYYIINYILYIYNIYKYMCICKGLSRKLVLSTLIVFWVCGQHSHLCMLSQACGLHALALSGIFHII